VVTAAGAGTLYVVATPLGNLDDLTTRAARVLRTVPVVAAEDTRHTRRLLHHLDAHPALLSYHAHSPDDRIAAILRHLEGGRDVALVSDAGTPVVSDPGARLVAAVRDAGFPVVPIPGASAVATALSAAGLPADRYVFAGFPPRKGAARAGFLARVVAQPWSIVLYEAANRLVDLLADLAQAAEPERRAVVARELTKLHEEIRAGTLAELRTYYEETAPRGEITLVLAGAGEVAEPGPDPASVETRILELLAEDVRPREVVQRLLEEGMGARNEIYEMVMRLVGEKEAEGESV
jgi:16S rRNA (cytidine1402-2'-O)-methyltransferase